VIYQRDWGDYKGVDGRQSHHINYHTAGLFAVLNICGSVMQ